MTQLFITIAMILAAVSYHDLVEFAKELGVKYVGKKKEDLRADLVGKVKAENKVEKVEKKSKDKADTKPVSKKEKTDAIVTAKKPEAKAVSISDKDIKLITGLPTKKERIIKLHDLGYNVPDFCSHALIDQHPTNCYAVLRNAGLSENGRTHSKETKDKIRATVVKKIEGINKLRTQAAKATKKVASK